GGGQTALIIKFWRNESKQPLDAFAHRLAAPALPVPEIVGGGRLPAPDGGRLTPRFAVRRGELVAFTVYRAVAGTRPASAWERQWDDRTRQRAYHQAGAWLRNLHQVRAFARSGPLVATDGRWEGTAADWPGYFAEQLERWDRELAAHDVPRAHRRLRRRVGAWLWRALPRLEAVERFVLCHRDFSFRNLLAYADGRLAAVIDFEHAIAGDPVFDWHRVAAWLLCHRCDAAAWQAFLAGYGADPAHADLSGPLGIYLAFYAVSGMGYALREADAAFYADSARLLEWVERHVL
ncbi:MAG TPA: aminoglycoside phosphotransferase family protein, partial [Bacillota bacterium]